MTIQKIESYQLDFFLSEEESEIQGLRKQIEAIGASSTKVRKGCYAKIGELTKEVRDLSERLAIIERNICQMGKEKNSEIFELKF